MLGEAAVTPVGWTGRRNFDRVRRIGLRTKSWPILTGLAWDCRLCRDKPHDGLSLQEISQIGDLQDAGSDPASWLDASRYLTCTYDNRIGGGGNRRNGSVVRSTYAIVAYI